MDVVPSRTSAQPVARVVPLQRSFHDLPLGHLSHCQVCGCFDLEFVLDLGHQPPCDSLLTAEQVNEAEQFFPLRLMRCTDCGLAQIDYTVAPEVLFHLDYPYRSGITETLSKNLQGIAIRVCELLEFERGSLVIDLGSNDGTILKGFQSQGMKVLGIEPTNIAQIANESGIPTVQEFFNEELARNVRAKHGRAMVVTAANMFAHVSNLGDLIRGVDQLLVDDGIFLTESHYLLDLLETVQYDSIYHEHLKYYALEPLVRLFDYYNFTVVDAERIPNYGGSIRVFAKKGKGHEPSDRLQQLIEAEHAAGLYDSQAFYDFRDKVIKSKLELQALLVDIRQRGETVVGIGCPGRSVTLLNYCNIDHDLLPYIAEQSTCLKVGLYSPGNHLPVVDEQRMFDEQPDYALMLSWHYSEPIVQKLREKGLRSKIIIPLPEVHVLED